MAEIQTQEKPGLLGVVIGKRPEVLECAALSLRDSPNLHQ